MADIARIEERLDRVAVGNTSVSDSLGGIIFQNMTEVMEFAKLMSLSGNAVPKHLQGNPGMCLAVCVQAMEWRFSPFAVANKSYEVQNRLSFESQLVHAVIEQRAPIIGRMRHSFDGEGDDRICIVTAKLRETGETLEYRSPPISKITPKNSPLWKTKPDLQLYYNTSRDFCRAYFPDVLLGVYAADELRDHHGPDNAKDVNERPSVGERLKSKGARGFNASHVERESRGGVVDETATKEYPQEASGTAREAPSTGSGTPDANQDVGAQPAPPLNSVSTEQPQPPQSDVRSDTPAAEDSPLPDAAGNLSLDSASTPGADNGGGDGVSESTASSPSLPEGWAGEYAKALGRAQKPISLPKYAAQFWEPHGGWAAITNAADRATGAAIYDAFKNNFGDREQIDAALRELV